MADDRVVVRVRVVVRGVSPLIVRTLEVASSATLARLHEALLVCFDWSGEWLHEFTIRAAGYSSDWMVGVPWSFRTVGVASLFEGDG